MATRYWVGSSGNWSDATNHWSNASGGSPNASYLPTAADDVVFDAASNGAGTSAFAVTVDGTSASPSLCASFSTGGAGGALDATMTLTMGATAVLNCNGSMTLPAANLAVSGTAGAVVTFVSTTSQTLTTNGVSLGNVSVTVNGVAGTLTLGSALTCSTITVTNGTLDTSGSNYNVTAVALSSSNSNTRTISLNGSTVTLSGSTPVTFTTATGLTLNAGTSTISCSAASPTFAGGGKTFYNVSFTSSSSGSITISGANTYNNLTFTSLSVTNIKNINLSANQTINGTFTPGTANASVKRLYLRSDTVGTARTITVNGTVGTLSDIDFRDITAVGSTPWTGTRLGDSKGNSGITFATPKTVYWNLAGSKLWSDTGWATTNNGVPAANNFPLAQDTATFTEAGAAGTVAFDTGWQIGSIQMADGVSNRTTAFTLNYLSNISVYGNITLFSGLTLTGTATVNFNGQGVTQTLTSAGVSFAQSITLQSVTGTLQLQDNLTLGSTLTTTLSSGTIDLNGKTLSTGLFSSSLSSTRAIAFGSNGSLTVTGSGSSAFNAATGTNLTTSGTGTISMTSASAKTFAGGGRSYPTLNQGGAGALTISGSNTFANITNTVQPATVTLTAGTTQTVTTFTLSGTAGNLITLNTTAAGSQATLSDSSGINAVSYVSIKDINATGGALWRAYTANGNVDGGNNLGWDFIAEVFRYMYSRRKNKVILPF